MTSAASKKRAIVTGGSGFLGSHLVPMLVNSGEYEVTIFDLREFPDKSVDCKSVIGNLLDPESVRAAITGHDVCFHTATFAPTGKGARSFKPMYEVNVVGTENVIRACQEGGCNILVYTSSASVAWDGNDAFEVDETVPYPSWYHDYYTETKMLGEKRVLEANGKGGLRTGIFGENDALMPPTTVRQCRRGKMRFIIGDGKNVLDWTYVGNVAHAHLLAATALSSGKPGVSGKPYFITNDDPRPFWGFLDAVLEGFGYPQEMRPHIKLPFWLILPIAFVVEVVIGILNRIGINTSTDFTVFRIRVAAKSRHFSCDAAKRELGYHPIVSVDEGLSRLIASMPHLSKEAMDAAEGVGDGAAKTVEERGKGRGRERARSATRGRSKSREGRGRGRSKSRSGRQGSRGRGGREKKE